MDFKKIIRPSIPAALALALSLAGSASALQTLNFNSGWRFNKGDATGAQAASYSDGSWTQVTLPHTIQVELTLGPVNYLGVCWYRKSFTQDASMQGHKVSLEFGAAMQTAQVWVNGTSKITHLGGYTPFAIDITKDLVSGTNVIAVRLDNNYNSAFEPGIAKPDFDYFGGLYRDVTLHVSDPIHVTSQILEDIPGGGGVFATYSAVSSSSATVQVKTHVRNESSASSSVGLKTTLVSASGGIGGTASSTQTIAAGADYTYSQTIVVSNPQLWSPDSPNLYQLMSEVSSGGTVVDAQSTEIGIRTIAFSRSNGFSINGKQVRLLGGDRHQDYPYIGNAVPASGQYRDALRLKEGGFNFVRMSHYVQSIDFVKACDHLGVLGMACTPGWHSPTDQGNSLIDVRQMIRYYRNSPSVVMWETVHNESSDPAAYVSAAKSAATQEYPGNQMYTAGENWNPGIDVVTPTEQSEFGTGRNTGKGAASSLPAVFSEYGDWLYVTNSPNSRVSRGDGESNLLVQAANFQTSLNRNLSLKWLAGDALWSYDDYQTQYSGAQVLRSGVIDLFRIPKLSYYFYQSQRDPSVQIPGASLGPMVYIASFWTSSSNTSVKVYSNCGQVRLSLNGTVVGTKSPDGGKNFVHAPFTFSVPFQSGTLLAEGLIGSTVAASYTVKTPGSAASLKVVWDTAGKSLMADGSDIAIVNAQVLDANGTVIPNASTGVTFSISSGAGTLIGNTTTNAVGGIASILLQTKATAGPITVKASASGLSAGSASANAVAPGTTDLVVPGRRISAVTGTSMHMDVSRSQLTVTLDGTQAVGQNLAVADAAGHLVRSVLFSGREARVDLVGVPRGVYVVSVGLGSARIQGKFLRE